MKILGNLLFMRTSAHEEAARCRTACLFCPKFDPDLTQNVGVEAREFYMNENIASLIACGIIW